MSLTTIETRPKTAEHRGRVITKRAPLVEELPSLIEKARMEARVSRITRALVAQGVHEESIDPGKLKKLLFCPESELSTSNANRTVSVEEKIGQRNRLTAVMVDIDSRTRVCIVLETKTVSIVVGAKQVGILIPRTVETVLGERPDADEIISVRQALQVLEAPASVNSNLGNLDNTFMAVSYARYLLREHTVLN